MVSILVYVFIFEEMSQKAFYFIAYFGSLFSISMFAAPLSSVVSNISLGVKSHFISSELNFAF